MSIQGSGRKSAYARGADLHSPAFALMGYDASQPQPTISCYPPAYKAAGIGAFGGLLFAAWRRRLSLGALAAILTESTETTGSLFFVLRGALLFSSFVNLAGRPDRIAALVAGLDQAPPIGLGVILLLYTGDGRPCVCWKVDADGAAHRGGNQEMDRTIFYPLVADRGFDLIWFGVVVVVVTEISLNHPADRPHMSSSCGACCRMSPRAKYSAASYRSGAPISCGCRLSCWCPVWRFGYPR